MQLQTSKNSLFTAQTADKTQHAPQNQKIEIDKVLPVDTVERYYIPIVQEKFFENNNYHGRIMEQKKHISHLYRENKNVKLENQSIHDENHCLRQQINKMMITKLQNNKSNPQQLNMYSMQASLNFSPVKSKQRTSVNK
jgi:hypothetical protein